jgi:adenylate cyclase
MSATRFVVAVSIALPVVGLALLLGYPRLDVEWQHQPSHFWLVLAAASINAVLAYATAIAARRRAEPRVFLVSMAFLVGAGFLGLHALATPGVLLAESNEGFQSATPVGLLLGSLFVAFSSMDLSGARGEWTIAHAARIQWSTLLLMGLWAIWSLARLPLLADPAHEQRSIVLAAAAIPAVGLYLLGAVRYLRLWRSRPSSILLGMAAAFVLLAEAMFAVAVSRSWHVSWWEWHLLMLGAFVIIAYCANRQWYEERFSDLYVAKTMKPQMVSVLFADLQGFTTFSESHDPAEVSEMLNVYFERVIPPIVDDFGGDVDRLIGDAIMATFNRRGNQPDHAVMAGRAAIALQERSSEVAHAHPGWPRFRVGVNTGEAVLGVLGAAGGRTHTVIGDTVNVASRLEGKAPVGGVAVSAATVIHLPDAVVEPLGELDVKGREQPVEAFRLVSM